MFWPKEEACGSSVDVTGMGSEGLLSVLLSAAQMMGMVSSLGGEVSAWSAAACTVLCVLA
jgi:hypothetical protein